MHLKMWKENNAAFRVMVKRSPVLEEASVLSENLAKISEIGLQAIGYMKNGVQTSVRMERKKPRNN